MTHNIDDEVFTISFDIDRRKITGIDEVSGVKKYWLEDIFGYFSKEDLFKTKNEALDHLIEQLEAMKDIVIRIELRKCPMCQTAFSEIAGLRSTVTGEEWVQICNNRDCTFEMITPVRKVLEAIDD